MRTYKEMAEAMEEQIEEETRFCTKVRSRFLQFLNSTVRRNIVLTHKQQTPPYLFVSALYG